eukprot:6478199-Amphidinium_carterae.3
MSASLARSWTRRRSSCLGPVIEWMPVPRAVFSPIQRPRDPAVPSGSLTFVRDLAGGKVMRCKRV